jgi:putative spermidine/putrescine transport system substrate-binding protein
VSRFGKRSAIASLVVSTILLAACSANGSGSGKAESKVLNMLCFSGDQQTLFEKYIQPGFEKKYHAKIAYTGGTSSSIYARLKASGGKPQYDIACMASSVLTQSRADGLLAKNDPKLVNNYFEKTEDYGKTPEDTGVFWGVLSFGLVYDPQQYADKHMMPPTSWNDLAAPENDGHVGFSTIDTSQGQLMLIMLAKANGGGEKNIDPGFTALEKVNKNAAAVIPGADFSQLFVQKEIWLATWQQPIVTRLAKETGLKLTFVYPKEGAVAQMVGMVGVANAEHGELAQKLLNYVLSPVVQKMVASKFYETPVARDLNISQELADEVGYTPEAKSRLVIIDDATVAQNLTAWTAKFNAIVSN